MQTDMTARQVGRIMRSDPSAALFLDRGQVYLSTDDGTVQLENGPAILCSFLRRHKLHADGPVYTWKTGE
jgi:hypothetical protein